MRTSSWRWTLWTRCRTQATRTTSWRHSLGDIRQRGRSRGHERLGILEAPGSADDLVATSWRFCAAQIALCHELFGFHGGAGQRGRPRGDMLDALGSAAGLATMNALYILTTLWRHLATGLARFRCARRMASASCCRSIGLIDKHHDAGDNDRPGQVFRPRATCGAPLRHA